MSPSPIERAVNLTAADALHLISAFLPLEWKQLKESDISISRSESGIINEVYFVTRLLANGVKEPNKLVIRKYGDMKDAGSGSLDAFVIMCATQIEMAVMQIELAHKSLGPKLYGLFDGGRIEEWIECRSMTLDAARDPEIERDIAVNMARVHCMDLPLRKPNYKFIDVLRRMGTGLSDTIPHFEELADESLLPVVKHDYDSLLNWMEPLLELDHHRMVFMNWDTHLGNIALLNKAQPDGLKVIIFDFDSASNNMRGKDLGLFLISRSGFHPHVREDRCLESNEEFYPFLKAYLSECEKELDVMDRDKKDSLDHVMIESLLGGIVSLLIYIFFQLKVMSVDKCENPVLLTYAKFVPVWFEGVIACEKALRDRFPGMELVFA